MRPSSQTPVVQSVAHLQKRLSRKSLSPPSFLLPTRGLGCGGQRRGVGSPPLPTRAWASHTSSSIPPSTGSSPDHLTLRRQPRRDRHFYETPDETSHHPQKRPNRHALGERDRPPRFSSSVPSTAGCGWVAGQERRGRLRNSFVIVPSWWCCASRSGKR